MMKKLMYTHALIVFSFRYSSPHNGTSVGWTVMTETIVLFCLVVVRSSMHQIKYLYTCEHIIVGKVHLIKSCSWEV